MDDGECIENNGKSKPPVCGAQCMVDKIYNAHQYYQSQAASGATTDLEALARLTDFAAMVTDGCLDCFVQGLGATLTGHFQSKAASEELWQRGIAPRLGLQIPNYLHPYYLSIRDSHTELMQTGYSPIFQDPSVEINGTGGNQAHHYWFFVQVGYEDDFLTGVVGSIAHETLLANDPIGRSYQDYALGVEGAKLGAFLRLGIVQPGDVGAYIRNTLSPDSVSSWIWENPPTYMP